MIAGSSSVSRCIAASVVLVGHDNTQIRCAPTLHFLLPNEISQPRCHEVHLPFDHNGTPNFPDTSPCSWSSSLGKPVKTQAEWVSSKQATRRVWKTPWLRASLGSRMSLTCRPVCVYINIPTHHRTKRGQHTHVEPRSIALHSIQRLLNRTLVHKIPQRFPRRAIDGLRRGLPLKDILPNSR